MRSSHWSTLWGVVSATSFFNLPSFSRVIAVLAVTAFLLSNSRVTPLYAQSLEQLAVGPPQIHRVAPPAAGASARELETTGDALQADKSYLDAVDYYQAALAKDPGNAVLVNKIGITQLQLHRYKDAKKSFERAIRMEKGYANAYANLGVIYYELGSYSKSLRNYDRAIMLDKNEAVFYNNRAASLFAKREFEKATADYAKALQLDPDVFERSERGGGVQARLPSPQDRAHYDYVLAKLYAQNKMPERSLHYLRKAMEDGYKNIKNVYRDEEFSDLRKDPRFAELMAARPMAIPE
ncbi:MAG: tetratricopeptide repeat protein [Terriglobales bacterium]